MNNQVVRDNERQIFVDVLSLVTSFYRKMDQIPLKGLIRSIYVLPAHWKDLFVEGTKENELLQLYVPEENRVKFRETLEFVLEQAASRSNRIFYFQEERDWKNVTNKALERNGYMPFRFDTIDEVRLYRPRT